MDDRPAHPAFRQAAGSGRDEAAVGRQDMEVDLAPQVKIKTRVGRDIDFLVGALDLQETLVFFAEKSFLQNLALEGILHSG